MKKIKRNGFTLVELMGVITILGIILLIAIPAVTRFLGKSKDLYFDQTIENIETATQEYLIDNPNMVPDTKDGYTEILLKTLIDNKYIDTIKNKDTKEECNENSVIRITSQGYKTQIDDKTGANNQLNIDVCLKCGTMNSPTSSCKSENVVSFADSNLQTISEYNLLDNSTYYPTIVKVGHPNEKVNYTNMKVYNQDIVSQSGNSIKALKRGTAVLEATVVLDGNTYITSLIVNVTNTTKPIDDIFLTSSKLGSNLTKEEMVARDIVYSQENFKSYNLKTRQTVNIYAYPYLVDDDRKIECSIIDNKGYNSVSVSSNNIGTTHYCSLKTGYKKITYSDEDEKENVYLYVKTEYAGDDIHARKIPLQIDLSAPYFDVSPSSVTLKTTTQYVYGTLVSTGTFEPIVATTSCTGQGISCAKSGMNWTIRRTVSNDTSCSGTINYFLRYDDGTGEKTQSINIPINCQCKCKKTNANYSCSLLTYWMSCSSCCW